MWEHVVVRLPPVIREKLTSSALFGVIFTTVLLLADLYVLITARFVPEYAIWEPPMLLEIVGWVLAVGLALGALKDLSYWLDPSKHPAITRLVGLGSYEERMGKLIEELEGPREQHGDALFTASFMIMESNYEMFPTDCIVWAWVTETQVREHSSYKVTVALRGGELFEFSSSSSDRENVILCIAQRPGNHIIGHDEELALRWKEEHADITAAIDRAGQAGLLPAGPEVLLGDVVRRGREVLARSREAVARAREQVAEARAKQADSSDRSA